MAKTAPLVEDDQGTVLPDLSANGINEIILRGAVADIEEEQAAIDLIMENARAACQPHADRIKEIIKDSAEAGIEKKAFRAKLNERKLQRKAQNCRTTLSDRQRDIFDEISVKLGDEATTQ